MDQYRILGIGAPCLDYVLMVDQDFLDSIPGSKNGMQPVDYPTFQSIIKSSGVSPILVAGGSACNTIKGLALLGQKCAILGKIGTDDAARFILDRLKAIGVISFFLTSTIPTAQVASLVSEDGSRTFRTFLGASSEMDAQDLSDDYFKGVSLVHIEGYSLVNGTLTIEAMKMAKKADAKVSFDLASFELALQHNTQIKEFLPLVDVLFANEQEVEALTGKDPELGCHEIKKNVKVSVVFLEKRGVLWGVKKGSSIFRLILWSLWTQLGQGIYLQVAFCMDILMGSL